MNRRVWIATALLSGLGARARATDHTLPRIDDLRQLAQEITQRRIPLLMLFGTAGCPYCLEVRRNYLEPRMAEAAGQVIIREVDMGSRRPLRTLDGGATTEAAFAERFDVRVVPVVVLLDARMMPLGEPLVGLDRSGFYEARLQATIDSARERLRARS